MRRVTRAPVWMWSGGTVLRAAGRSHGDTITSSRAHYHTWQKCCAFGRWVTARPRGARARSSRRFRHEPWQPPSELHRTPTAACALVTAILHEWAVCNNVSWQFACAPRSAVSLWKLTRYLKVNQVIRGRGRTSSGLRLRPFSPVLPGHRGDRGRRGHFCSFPASLERLQTELRAPEPG